MDKIKKAWKRAWIVLLVMWRPALIGLAAILVVFGLFIWRLDSLTSGLSQPEIDTYNTTRNLGDLLDNSVNAPYRASVYLSTKIMDNTFGLRLVGAIVGALSIIIFYMVSRKLYKPTIALATTAMFASTSLLLSTSRLATANVMLLSLLVVIAVGYMVRFDKRQELAWILLSIVIGLSLYVPGMAVIILLAAIWQFTRIRKSFEALAPATIIISSVTLSLLAAPIVINIIRFPELWQAYLGLPETFARLKDMGMEILRALGALFVIAPYNPVYWLGRQPVLDVFASILFFFGWWSLFKRLSLDRLWTLLGIFVIVLAWVGVATNIVYIVALLPFVYIVIGFGLQSLLSQWQGVFPRNPIARSVGLSLIIITVALAVNFQLQRYFVAWAHNAETKAAFSQKYPE